ncbi:MAG TPA: kynureninase [Candidatus Limnocylindria bacterium]|nr:kynureninase [Candidatus Limnocylindria bacterium]
MNRSIEAADEPSQNTITQAALDPGSLDPGPLDAADPLARFRDRFAPIEPGLVYLDGNSLGRPTKAALERVAAVAEAWSTRLIGGWDEGWLELPVTVGDQLARGVLGAEPGTVAMTDSTTVNLYRLAAAALDARRSRRAVVIERSEFPTDRYVVGGLARERDLEIRWLDGDPVEGLTTSDVTTALDTEVALVILSAANYRSGAIADIRAVTDAARAADALVLWDLSHAAGSIPVNLESNGVDLAVGCTYKYLNGGPGAPAFLYVRRELQDELRPPIQGWFAQSDQFEMGPTFERRPGIEGWLVGTPGILGLTAAQAGIEVVAEAGIDAIRWKGIALTEYAVSLLDAWLAPLGCPLGSPRDAARRGAHIAIRHPNAGALAGALIERSVIVDYRAPDSIRVGMSPLTTSFEDVHRGISSLRSLLA